jgi:hypothetical protein
MNLKNKSWLSTPTLLAFTFGSSKDKHHEPNKILNVKESF